jgi:hypothetical protein
MGTLIATLALTTALGGPALDGRLVLGVARSDRATEP